MVFPTKAEDLFAYEGLILGSVETGFFSRAQQEMIKQFVDRRGRRTAVPGRARFARRRRLQCDPFAELLPVILPHRKNTFQREAAEAVLTDAGKQSLICRIDDQYKPVTTIGRTCRILLIIRTREQRSLERLSWPK